MMRSMHLQTRILLGILGVIAFTGLLTNVFVRIALNDILNRKLEKRAVSLAKHMAQASINPLLTEKYHDLDMMVKDYQGAEQDIEYIFIADPHRVIRAHTFEGGFPRDLEQLIGNHGGRNYRYQVFAAERGEVVDIGIPLLDGSVGELHLGMSQRGVRQDINEVVRLITWIIAAVLAGGIVIAVVLSRTIARPVLELAAAAKAVEGGDLNVRVQRYSNDEIGHLGTTLYNMIHARRMAEEQLKRSEEKLRNITANLGEGVMVLDGQCRLVFMNPEAERLLGWKADELKGRDMHDLIHSEHPDGSRHSREHCPNINVITSGERSSVENDMFIRSDGSKLPVAYITAPMVEQGATTGIVIAFHDITLRMEADAERELLITQLQRSLENVKTLSGMLPICASCKKIRDDSGYWKRIESYISEHSEAEFTHGICPECSEKLYPGFFKNGQS